MIFNKEKEQKQRIKELEDTCKQLEELIDYKNKQIQELEYVKTVAEKSNTELNKIIDNLLAHRRTIRIRQARKIEVNDDQIN